MKNMQYNTKPRRETSESPSQQKPTAPLSQIKKLETKKSPSKNLLIISTSPLSPPRSKLLARSSQGVARTPIPKTSVDPKEWLQWLDRSREEKEEDEEEDLQSDNEIPDKINSGINSGGGGWHTHEGDKEEILDEIEKGSNEGQNEDAEMMNLGHDRIRTEKNAPKSIGFSSSELPNTESSCPLQTMRTPMEYQDATSMITVLKEGEEEKPVKDRSVNFAKKHHMDDIILKEGQYYLSLNMLTCIYSYLRESCRKGQTQVSFEQIDVNSFQFQYGRAERGVPGMYLSKTKSSSSILQVLVDELEHHSENENGEELALMGEHIKHGIR